MHICIDESGTFSIPRRRGPSISCVGALTIPDSTFGTVTDRFTELSASWPRDHGEIKGRLIRDPNNFYDYVGLLVAHGCFFDCVALDMGLVDASVVAAHRDAQASRLVAGLNENHRPALIYQMRGIANEMRAMPLQQYAQFVAQIDVVNSILSTKPLYYCQAAPAEIGNFHWRIDAKDSTRTRAEHIWRMLTPGLLESRSFREPSIALIGGDYSHFDRFRSRLSEEEMEARRSYHRAQPMPDNVLGEGGFDPGKILREDMEFADSRQRIELQMADVITSLAARALRGNVGRRAWWHLGQIMHRPLRHEAEVLHLITFDDDRARWTPAPAYHEVLRHLRRTAQSLLLPDTLAASSIART